MYYSQNFKEKIGEPVSGGTVITGTLNKLGKWMTDYQITEKWNIEPISIPDFFATVDNLIATGEMKKEVYGHLFYIKATDGRTLTVNAYWNVKQWKFSCYEFDGFGEWLAEPCVFSPAITLNPSTPSPSETLELPDTITLERAIGICVMNGYQVIKNK